MRHILGENDPSYATFPLSSTLFAIQLKERQHIVFLVTGSDGEFAIHRCWHFYCWLLVIVHNYVCKSRIQHHDFKGPPSGKPVQTEFKSISCIFTTYKSAISLKSWLRPECSCWLDGTVLTANTEVITKTRWGCFSLQCECVCVRESKRAVWVLADVLRLGSITDSH